MNTKQIKALVEKVNGKLVGVASSESKDRSGERLRVSGWDFTNFNKNPVLQFAHKHDEPPIGLVANLRIVGNKVFFDPIFHTITQLAREVKAMYEAEPPIMRAFSVGFIPKAYDEKDRSIVTEMELLEISAVPIGSNYDALLVVAKSFTNDDVVKVKNWVEEVGAKKDVNEDFSNSSATVEGKKATPACRMSDESEGECHQRKISEMMEGGMGEEEATQMATEMCGVMCKTEIEEKSPACRMEGESKDECVARKIPEIKKENPDMDNDQAVAIAFSLCDKSCSEKGEEKDLEIADIKPYPNEHSCRLNSPDKYDRFARKNCEIKHDDKCIDVIYGIKEGKSEIQAMRYKKDIWTEETAKNHCKSHEGSFEAASGEEASEKSECVECKGKKYVKSWNPTLSKIFDVENVHSAPANFEYEIFSKYLECEVKKVFVNSFIIESPLLGTYLAGLKEILSKFELKDIRNFNWNGSEVPPISEVIKLNSQLSDDFLVNGTAFYVADSIPLIMKYEPSWVGLSVDIITNSDSKKFNKDLLESLEKWAKENNFLKKEKFALNGEFLPELSETWDDILVKKEIKEIIKRPIDTLNAKGQELASRGMLFIGEPGTGKTKTGKAIMREANATFIWVSSKDFQRLDPIKSLSLAFKLARDLAPTVLFIEDIDTWLRDYTIDLLKTELDGIRENRGLITILTSNSPEKLPDALLDRPGRFHDIVEFGLPDKVMRGEMIKKWAGEVDEKTFNFIVDSTEGFSGAYVKELVEFAKSIVEDSGCELGVALITSLEKLQKQRNLITRIREKVVDIKSVVLKEGRVLSGKNRQIIQQAVVVLQELLDASEAKPATDGDGEPLKGRKEEAQGLLKDRTVVRALQKISGDLDQILREAKKTK